MRQRTTFLQSTADVLDPSRLKISADEISGPKLHAARHDKLTFTVDELPQELYRILKASREFRVRWSSFSPYQTSVPVSSRLPPGLHVFYAPKQTQADWLLSDGKQYALKPARDILCSGLKKAFGSIVCEEFSANAILADHDQRKAGQSPLSHYYHGLEDLSMLIVYLRNRVCGTLSSIAKAECSDYLAVLERASSLDVDYSPTKQTITISTFYSHRQWSPRLRHTSHHAHLEVGLLTPETPTNPSEVTLSGFLTTPGHDAKPKPVLFSFPSRHHPTAGSFTTRFLTPTGLHPTMELHIKAAEPPGQDSSCKLYAYLSLPSSIFADRYQLADDLFLASKYLSRLHHMSRPVDLEAPDYTVDTWGSTVLLQLAPPSPSQALTIEIPLHLRYLPPSNHSGHGEIHVPDPIVFWACDAGDVDGGFANNPFDRTVLGYDALFADMTTFHHLEPESVTPGAPLRHAVSVPVLPLDQAGYVERGTAAAVIMGFLWIMWCAFGVWMKDVAVNAARARRPGTKKTQ